MTKSELKAKYVATVVATVGGDREHGWGVTDSMKVITMVMTELTEGTVTVERHTVRGKRRQSKCLPAEIGRAGGRAGGRDT